MITITVLGFTTKQEAIYWLNQYAGGIEQNFDTEASSFPAISDAMPYIQEMELFEKKEEKINFNLKLI